MSEHREIIKTSLHVRYAETDSLGIAHHSSYVIWFEEGRSEYMRRERASYDALQKNGVYLPLAELDVRYFAPARYGDRITICTWVGAVRSRTVTFIGEIVKPETHQVLARARTKHICIDTQTGQLKVIPQQTRECLKRYLIAEEA
jgi:acyl-CoA thioester hydrolase